MDGSQQLGALARPRGTWVDGVVNGKGELLNLVDAKGDAHSGTRDGGLPVGDTRAVGEEDGPMVTDLGTAIYAVVLAAQRKVEAAIVA